METSGPGPTGETIDTPRHRALGSTTRVEILRLVRAAAPAGVTANQIADRTGRHLSTVRAHLDRLAGAGLLVRARAAGAGVPGRPPWRYRAAPTDPVPAPAPYRALATALLDELIDRGGDVATEAARVGRRWGRRLAAGGGTASGDGDGAVPTVLAVLAALGFSPRRQAPPPAPADSGAAVGAAEVHLHSCPFLELVASHPDAMCGLHLGVVRGALERSGEPGTDATLEPFGAPTACVVRLPVRR